MCLREGGFLSRGDGAVKLARVWRIGGGEREGEGDKGKEGEREGEEGRE